MTKRWVQAVLVALGGVGALAAVVLARDWPDRLLYNHSPSVPVGFYVRADASPAVGDFVTVRARDVAPASAAARQFDGNGDRFIKRLAAREGDRVCVRGANLEINDQFAARVPAPRAGLAIWRGCRLLAAGEVLLLGDTPDSFDGRYWGPIPSRMIEGVWRRL